MIRSSTAAFLAAAFLGLSVLAFSADAQTTTAKTTTATKTTTAAKPAVAPAKALTAPQRAEIEAMLEKYIADHPEKLIASVETYYNKQVGEKAKQEGRLENAPGDLVNDPSSPYVGPKDAKHAVVEFFDYNCGYCKQVAADVTRLSEEEKDVKIVFKELPILSATSETASRYALAANKQGKYLAYHNALMGHQGPIDEAFLESAAKELGLDVAKLKKDAVSPETSAALGKNVALAKQLGVRGTPFFVIGKEKVPGAISYTQMKTLLDQERGLSTLPEATTTSTTTTSTSDADVVVAPAPAPAPAAAMDTPKTATDPEVQREIEQARAETKAMIEEIKKQTADLQKAQTEALKEAAAEAAKKSAATKN